MKEEPTNMSTNDEANNRRRLIWFGILLFWCCSGLLFPFQLQRAESKQNDGKETKVANDENTSRTATTLRQLGSMNVSIGYFDDEAIARNAIYGRDSSKTQASLGMDLYENVCVKPCVKPSKHHKFISFGYPLQSTMFQSILNYPQFYATWFLNSKKQHWNETIANENVTWIAQETALLHQPFSNNIAHCLGDLIFTLHLDAWQRRLYSENDVVYPQFLYSGRNNRFIDFSSRRLNYCEDLLQRLRIVDFKQGSSWWHGLGPTRPTMICFKQVLVPFTALHRFPLDWNSTSQGEKSMVDSLYQQKGGHWKGFIDKYNRERMPSYPAEALNVLRERALNGVELDPKASVLQPSPTNQNNVTILLYDRKNSKNRVLENSGEIKLQLEARYPGVQVDLWGKEYGKVIKSLKEQAQLFFNYSHMILVHGAHEANLLFCRRGSKIMEIMPFPIEPQPRAMDEKDDKNVTAAQYYGQSGWFPSFTRRIGALEHFTYGASSQRYLSPPSFQVENVTEFVELVGDRFGLVN